ncbi:MAG: hypothetical protein HEQ32_04045 [Vampirovibrio sp.]
MRQNKAKLATACEVPPVDATGADKEVEDKEVEKGAVKRRRREKILND